MSRACSALGLPIDIGFSLALGAGDRICTVACIPFVGAKNGMLVIRGYDEVRMYEVELINAGYGYSVLDEPQAGEEFDLDAFKEMFAEWGWCGESSQKPSWM